MIRGSPASSRPAPSSPSSAPSQLHGRAELGEDVETSRRTGLALYERAAGALTDDMRAAVDAMAADRVAVTVVPERVVSWDHRKLPGARPADVGR